MLFFGTSIIHHSTEGVFLLCNILDLLIHRKYHKLSYFTGKFGGFLGEELGESYPPNAM